MQNLTREEFEDRINALQEAEHIFGALTEKNLTNAFIAYQKILAIRHRPIILDSKEHGNRPRTRADNYQRPLCPDCNFPLMFRPVPINNEGIQTQLICSNDQCNTVLNSENDMSWWMEEIAKESKNA